MEIASPVRDIADPKDITIRPQPPTIEPEPLVKGLKPFTNAQRWLHEHRHLDMRPYAEFPSGKPALIYKKDLRRFYPGIADKITEAYEFNYDDEMILQGIENMVDNELKAGNSDAQIEKKLFYADYDYHPLDRPIGSFYYGRPENPLEKAWDYLGTTEDFETSPIRHELRYVVERFLGSYTIGLTDVLQKEVAKPETITGSIYGAGASLAGFLLGPKKIAQSIIGGRLAPTAEGLKGMVQLMTQGSANLGLASGISSLLPSISGNQSLEETAIEIFDSTATGALTGFLYPLTGAIPTKVLRMSVGLAALDVIRNKGEMSIDDVLREVKDGTIDREELAEKSFGYLLDLYFINKVPSMKTQLTELHNNAVVRRMLEANPKETEQVILQIRNSNLIPKNPENFLNGLNKWQKITAFGSEKNFNSAYQQIVNEQIKLTNKIQADIQGKSTIRIPKELSGLAQKSRQFRSPLNFETAAKSKLSPTEKESLQETTKGDLRKFWQGVQDRDYLEKQSMIQHKGQAEKILDAMKVEQMYNKADTELQRLNDGKIRRAYQEAARALWDTSATVKRDLLKKGGQLGREAVIRHDLIKGASAKSAHLFKQASGKIYSGLTKAEEITLNRIIQSHRTIAIDKYRADMKHPEGLGLKEHQAYLDTIDKKTYAKLRPRAELYFKEMDGQLDQLYRAGIISRESYAGLREKGDYSPRRFIQHIDTERTYNFGGKKITVWDSGIKALDEGSFQTLENNSRALLAMVISRTQARIFRNTANKALYNLAKEKPDNNIVKISEIIEVSKQGKPKFQKTPAGHTRIGVMIDGQMREMILPSNMAKEWVSSDPAISAQTANWLGWLSGAKILRPMATGINPEFAITNLPRDIAHAWLVTNEYSPHLPIAGLQLGKDYAKVLSDTLFRRGAWHDYLNEGGGMNFLTHQGGGGKGRAKAGRFAKLRDVLGYLGETSEILTRLALRNRALKNGRAPHEATWIARSGNLDFSQGGWAIKAADSAVPYLNASVQGTRGLFRAAKDKPLTFTYKLAELGTLATGLYLANKHTNPEALDEISDHDKANYFIITSPLSYTDDEGNKRHLYFRVAKDQSQKLVCTLFENMMAKYYGEDISIDQVTDSAKGLISLTPTEAMPPSADALLGYFANKDFWRNEDIWKGADIESKEEYRADTHPALVKFGELTGASPERTGYALEQFLTYGNIYTTLTGGGLRLIMDKLPEDVREQSTQEMLNQAPFLRRVLKTTDPYTKHAKLVEKARQDEATRRYVQSRELDALSETYYSGKETDEKVRDFLSKQAPLDRQRLLARHQRYGRLRDIPDRRWWLNLIDMPPETAATVYHTRYSQADETEQQKLDETLRKVPGVISDRFMLRLNQLKTKGNKNGK